MNNSKDQIELSKIIAQKTELSQATVDAFVRSLFIEIQNSLESESSVSVEGLGIFRIIKSGDSNKILFLGSKQSISDTIDYKHLKDELEGKTIRKKTPKNILSVTAIDTTNFKPNSSISTVKPQKRDLLDKIEYIETPIEKLKGDNQREEKIILKDTHTFSTDEQDEIDRKKNNTENNSKSAEIDLKKIFIIEKEEDKITQTNDSLRKKQLNREEKKKDAIIIPIFIAILLLIAIAGVGYLFFENAQIKNNNKFEIAQKTVSFEELSVNDSSELSYMVIPDMDVSLEYIANHYYGNEMFWPYIYIKNEAFMTNSTIVSAGSIIKIPKLMIDLAAYNDGSTITNAQILGDKIKKTKKIY